MTYSKANVTRPNHVICDLRSDTVTLPDDGMRRAMADADLGDDVYGDDPSVNRLEEHVAARTGKEDALFVPSGTMSNLSAVLAHCGRGEEIIIGRDYHIAADEAAGCSVLGGVAICTIPVEADGGLSPQVIEAEIKPDDSHQPISKLLAIENTHGGKAVSLDRMSAMVTAARDNGLSVHLDGARYFNATHALGCSDHALASYADTVSICLSKGLGAPSGSALAGPRELLAKARRYRKMLGGGMRQSGVLAAAGLYALDHNVARLGEDHERARALAALLTDLDAGTVSQATNMVFLKMRDRTNEAFREHMHAAGIIIGGGATGSIRIVLHKGVGEDAMSVLTEELQRFFG